MIAVWYTASRCGFGTPVFIVLVIGAIWATPCPDMCVDMGITMRADIDWACVKHHGKLWPRLPKRVPAMPISTSKRWVQACAQAFGTSQRWADDTSAYSLFNKDGMQQKMGGCITISQHLICCNTPVFATFECLQHFNRSHIQCLQHLADPNIAIIAALPLLHYFHHL